MEEFKKMLKSRAFWAIVTAGVGTVAGYSTGEMNLSEAITAFFTGLGILYTRFQKEK